MKTFQKKLFLLILVLLTLAVGAWTGSPAKTSAGAALQAVSSDCEAGADKLTGRSGSLMGVKDHITLLCSFAVDMSKVPSNVSRFDEEFISDSISSNTLELQSLQFADRQVTNAEWKGQIEMMIALHTYDLALAIEVAQKIGVDTTPNLTNASVYPETPDYDLGKRTENLVDEYLNPLKNTSGVDFNGLSLAIIQAEHVPDIQSELAAERLVKNAELRAFARHSADVSELHILLMSDLHHRLLDNYTPPAPDFQVDYQDPHQFLP